MLIQADVMAIPLVDESVQCVVTSPPYWGLRDYGITPRVWGGREDCEHTFANERLEVPGGQGGNWAAAFGGATGKNRYNGDVDAARTPQQIITIERGFCVRCSAWRGSLGLEPTPELYVEHIVTVFREVRRVLRNDGTCWVNLGDSYAANRSVQVPDSSINGGRSAGIRSDVPNGLKPKDLVGIPWRVAFALQADGWWLRSDIIWAKPNPMPESVTDRPTKAHEYLFLLAKSERYYFDQDAVKEKTDETTRRAATFRNGGDYTGGNSFHNSSKKEKDSHGDGEPGTGRNIRSVWTIATQPYAEAHFATFPEDLVKPCILAGTSHKGCCPECREPWERVVENPDFSKQPKRKTSKDAHFRNGDRTSAGQEWQNWRNENPSRTLGWEPGCECKHKATVACRVLDPFSGSGTVVKVAQDLGRIGIGLDLKPEYLKMAKKRTSQQGFGLR